jgi:hypothetical protein
MKGMDQSKRVKGLGYKLGRDLIHPSHLLKIRAFFSLRKGRMKNLKISIPSHCIYIIQKHSA